MKLIPNGRIWIDTEHGALLGYGRIELLEKIQETGSLRKAALDMKMSYQQAWNLINQMNEHCDEPLVIMQRGGRNGGTTTVSKKGIAAIAAFKKFNLAFQGFLLKQRIKF